MVRMIPLTQGYVALCDDCDYEYLSQWKWHASVERRRVYAKRKVGKTSIYMHLEVFRREHQASPIPGFHLDHEDGNGLNNRRGNIRGPATPSQNLGNSRRPLNNTSGIKGVSRRSGWQKRRKIWQAKIGHNERQIHLGYFYTPEEAARAYELKARELFGEFAKPD